MTTYTLQTKLNFGKYKSSDVVVGELIDNDPDYIAWCVDTIEWFELDDEAEKELDAALGLEDKDELGDHWTEDYIPGEIPF